jgi:uncharacterized phage protein (TIGR01671 family)
MKIKFRAWDRKLKKYWYDVQLFQSFNDLNGNSDYCGFHRILMDDRFIPEQFTGDKNGVETFAGDIIKCYDLPFALENRSDIIGVIEYNGNCFSLKSNGVFLDNWLNAETFEVIGNIHQNQDLLK